MSTTLNWFKSSYSSGQGGECLEVALTWTKSSRSSEQGGECLEVAATPAPTAIHIRDSKNSPASGGPTLHVSPATWAAFLTHPHPHAHAALTPPA
ncbi:DUF397 domain-containing protein [Streptomyces sp. NPDC005562]|uniref:DUF397 domain-containing protein n=1 Tax=Streptomyces sp. NPDC005562 TaxID=3154890 RepID=UPI0033A3A74C